jgi:hypothetical protein
MSRCHLIRQKSIISNNSSGVAGFNFCLIKEFLEVLNVILTLSMFGFDKYCYLLYYSISFKNSFDFFLRSP